MLRKTSTTTQPYLVCNGLGEQRCPERDALCPFDNLLVHRLRRVVHDHRAILVVDLRVDARVADEVHDPLLALVLVQAEASGEVPACSR